MVQSIAIWLLVAAFSGAGIYNALGTARTRADFERWGFPSWWCRVTGFLEVVVAVLIALAPLTPEGLALGSMIIVAAIATVVLRREWSHLPPLIVFAFLLAAAAL